MKKIKKYDPNWNFEEDKMKQLSHHLHPYPAMLMPLIIRNLLHEYGVKDSTVILDPYVGSGTTLVEAQYYGAKEAIGIDLNPLAILISNAKTSKYNFSNIKVKIREFISESASINYELDFFKENIHNFSIRDSWFKEKNVIELAFIQKFIDEIEDTKVKLFFKVSFSEVVRDVSLTRKNEFKLYRIPKTKIDNFNPNGIEKFIEIMEKNFNILKEYNTQHLHQTKITILERDAVTISQIESLRNYVDIVITSPPYGDSNTTVAYGQFSRLANEWLKIEKANQIDRVLMGGSVKGVDFDKRFCIPELDEAIDEIRTYDQTQKNKRYPDVISFYEDYLASIKSVAGTIKKGGYAIYVVGNRRVRNIQLPTDLVTVKGFEREGFVHEKTIIRDIINKRMPSKNSPSNQRGKSSETMSNEYIIIMRKER